MDEREGLQAFVDSLDKWAIVCGIFVAIGVVGESVVGYLHWTKGNRLHVLEETARLEQQTVVETARQHAEEASLKVATATKDIETARKEAAEANARAAESNERVALAEQAAAEANLRLEQFKAPRRLTDAQRSTLLDAMREYPATKFDMGIQGSDPEAMAFAGAIETLLLAAGWVEVAYAGPGDVAFTRPGKPTTGMINLDGVVLQTHQQAGNPAGAAARLAGILNGLGVKTTLASGSSTNMDGVHVYVGKKAG